MANHSSTKKAIRKVKTVTEVNRNRKSRIKTYIKKVIAAAQHNSNEDTKNALIQAQSEIMKGVAKGVIKKNTGARKVSRLAKLIKQTAS
ncbi:MAG: 30S ribosomal protein S20 [Rickettsiaceae bacterium]|nr:30S ribosomal protein S20 [Rickettsiaceae bacterium]